MTDIRENKEASLQAIYAKISRIAAEANLVVDVTTGDSGHVTSCNVVCLSKAIALRSQERRTRARR